MPVTDTSGACDWPETGTNTLGLMGSLLSTSSCALRVPVGSVGWKRSLNCTEVPGATLNGKVVFGVRNSGSDGRMLLTVSVHDPALLTVMGRSTNDPIPTPPKLPVSAIEVPMLPAPTTPLAGTRRLGWN